MNQFYQSMVEDMINESENYIFDDDGLDDVVGILSDGESDKVVLHDDDEDIDDDDDDEIESDVEDEGYGLYRMNP